MTLRPPPAFALPPPRAWPPRTSVATALAAVAAVAALLLVGCGPDRCPGGCPTTRDGGDGGGDASADGDGASTAVTFAIDPADAVLTLRGAAPTVTQTFRLIARHGDGSTEPITGATFRADDAAVGAFAADLFTSAGVGRTTVRASGTFNGRDVSATGSVTVTRVITLPGDVPDADRAAFDGTPQSDPAHASPVLYPLDGALVPQNLPPPQVQWDRGTTGDVYRVVVARPHAEIDAFVRHTGDAFAYTWAIDAAAWNTLLALEPDAPIAIRVEHLEAASRTVYAGAPVALTIARAPLFGQLYYTQTPNLDGTGPRRQRLARIDVASARQDLLAPNPPYPPIDPGDPNGPARCVGCHAISRDGRWASTVTGVGNNAMFDLTADLEPDPTPTRYPSVEFRMQVPGPFYTSSFNPDGTRLVIAMYGPIGRSTGFAIVDPANGASIAATGLPGMLAATPRWSPDGSAIAFIATGDDSEDGSSTGDLELLPQRAPDAFGSPRVLHQGGDLATAPERGTADSHPDFSPDGAWIAFQHGTRSASRMRPPSALYVIPTAGGTPIRLHAASGGVDGHDAFWPVFSPFVTHEPGGASHYWVAFVSLRDFGNAIAGTRGARRPQIWVSAVDGSPTAAADPSHAPFHLAGQDPTATNLMPAWAAPACREAGESTDSPTRCCSGATGPDPAHEGATICAPPTTCRALGATCGVASDCCAGLACEHHTCVPTTSGSH